MYGALKPLRLGLKGGKTCTDLGGPTSLLLGVTLFVFSCLMSGLTSLWAVIKGLQVSD
jgi:hypothetical protein